MKPTWQDKEYGIDLYCGDCLDVMPGLDCQVDMTLCDPPYGTTACKWDSIIPLEPMWLQLKRLAKANSAIVMTASQPFTTTLISSNMGMFKYCWVWEKSKATGYLTAKKRPLVKHEDICVFYTNPPAYNPQGLREKAYPTISKGNRGLKGDGAGGECYGDSCKKDTLQTHTNYPLSILKQQVDMMAKFHPTQKPVALMEYLIKTYTQEGETILDFTFGSGTCGVAAVNLGRKFIGIEMEPKYFKIAVKRISEAIIKKQGGELFAKHVPDKQNKMF